jgi:hypothetical protein
MDEYESLSHTKWECKYHVTFIPKFRRKVLYGKLRQHLGEVFRTLAAQKESRIEEGHLLADQRDSPGEGVRREKEEFCGAAFLGARVLGVDGRSG